MVSSEDEYEGEVYDVDEEVEETHVFEYSDLSQDERAGILIWYFSNRTINEKPYEWIIDSSVSRNRIDEMSSIALIEFIEEWNEELEVIKGINRIEPILNVKMYLVLSKSSTLTYRISREYIEGGIITIEKTLELYTSSKALDDVLDIYATTSTFTRNNDYIWKF